MPEGANATDIIRAVPEESTDETILPEKQNATIALGYVKPRGKIVIFAGNKDDSKVILDENDKLIVFSNH